MGFRESLLKKIALDGLTRKIRASLGADTGTLDRESLRKLLGETDYRRHDIRDLEVWMREMAGEPPDILVLDNGLGRYRTSLEDVALRKSPTVKEMIRFRNARKILSDGDVLVSRREKTLDFLHDHCLGLLDLSWTLEDIAAIADAGALALEIQDVAGVETALLLFTELLGLRGPPVLWKSPGWWLRCLKKREGEKTQVRNLTAFSGHDCRLLQIEGPLYAKDSEAQERVAAVFSGRKQGDHEGREVFSVLLDAFSDYKA